MPRVVTVWPNDRPTEQPFAALEMQHDVPFVVAECRAPVRRVGHFARELQLSEPTVKLVAISAPRRKASEQQRDDTRPNQRAIRCPCAELPELPDPERRF